MNQSPTESLRQTLDGLKKEGQEFVSIEALINYLEKTKGEGQYNQETQLAVFKAQHESNLEHYKAQQQVNLATYTAINDYAQIALKTVILINGGASISLLAFIGNIWTKGINKSAVESLTNSIAFFAFGVLIAAVATAFGYFTQFCYSTSQYSKNKKWQIAGYVIHILALVLVIGAYCFFALGIYYAYDAFVAHLAI